MAFGVDDLIKAVWMRRSVGVYVGEDEVTVCQAALGPFGPVGVLTRSEPFHPEDLPRLLETLVKPLLPARRTPRATVSVGLPALRVFFATRPFQLTDRNAAANVLLHDVLKSSEVNVDDMEVDMVKAQPGKKPLAVMVACRRKYLAGLLSAFEKCGVRPHRTEPAPFALLRLARARHRDPRRAKTVVRVFLGGDRALAVLACGGLPLAWRAFALAAGSESSSVSAAVKSIQIVARFRGEVGVCEAVMIHGRPDLNEALGGEGFHKSLGAPVRHTPDPAYDGPSIALGLAMGALEGAETFDLGRAMKSRPPLWEVLPFGDVALQVALLFCVTLFLYAKDGAARDDHRRVTAEVAKYPWMKALDDGKLEKERKELESKVAAIHQFLGTRIVWTGYTRDASARLPDAMALQSLVGVNELESGKAKAKSKKSLTLKLSVPISIGHAMPREIDDYLDVLRRDVHLRRDFPVIELADLKWNQPTAKGASAVAVFTVHCLPAEKTKAAPGAGAPKAKAAGG